jgi:hypothetical protein
MLSRDVRGTPNVPLVQAPDRGVPRRRWPVALSEKIVWERFQVFEIYLPARPPGGKCALIRMPSMRVASPWRGEIYGVKM